MSTEKNPKKYVILEGIGLGNRFYSMHTEGRDPTKSWNGETWYKIIGWASTSYEAQEKLGIPMIHRTTDKES